MDADECSQDRKRRPDGPQVEHPAGRRLHRHLVRRQPRPRLRRHQQPLHPRARQHRHLHDPKRAHRRLGRARARRHPTRRRVRLREPVHDAFMRDRRQALLPRQPSPQPHHDLVHPPPTPTSSSPTARSSPTTTRSASLSPGRAPRVRLLHGTRSPPHPRRLARRSPCAAVRVLTGSLANTSPVAA